MAAITAHIALLAWIPVVLVLFGTLPARRAIITSFLVAWLFLPMFGYRLPGFPDYTKTTATSIGVMLGILLFDPGRLGTFRYRWFDLPMTVWCLVPFASAVSAGYGPYEGMSGIMYQSITWGLPYFIGRLYFSDTAGMRELAVGIVIGALIYVPLCAWEMRMSPHLHKLVYGYHQHSFRQTIRLGGYRPMVFMQHGLAVGLFMCLAALISLWCWLSGALRMVWKIPASWATGVLAVTGVLCRSTGAVAIMLVGCAALLAARYLRTPLVLALVVAAPLLYMGARTVGGWDGRELIESTSQLGKTQEGSLAYRMNSENGVWDIVQDDLLFGMGRFSIVGMKTEASGDQEIVPDGMWIIALAKYGVVGLVAWSLVLILPPVRLLTRHRVRAWLTPALGPAAALALLSALYLWDSVLNAMVNPLWLLAIGGGTACCGAATAPRPAPGGVGVRRVVRPAV